MAHPYTEKVRRYYDANTSVFRVFEPAGDTIHRAVWAEGVADRRQAMEFTNGLAVAEAKALVARGALASLRAIDLGCGTGGTFLYFGDRLHSTWSGLGVTLSPLQVRRANDNFRRHAIEERCFAIEADYVSVPDDGPFDVAIAIESFVHCPEPPAFFREVARLLRPGGRLLLCDDLLSERAATSLLDESEKACLRELSRGWHAPAMQSARQVERLAADVGLRIASERDLTPLLHLLPGTGYAVGRAALGTLLRAGALDNPLVRSLSGGLALQLGLRRGLIEYRWMVFERESQ
jgi:cyclopropane fatty-acyl-phospholipid synthase-like methyltransferase